MSVLAPSARSDINRLPLVSSSVPSEEPLSLQEASTRSGPKKCRDGLSTIGLGECNNRLVDREIKHLVVSRGMCALGIVQGAMAGRSVEIAVPENTIAGRTSIFTSNGNVGENPARVKADCRRDAITVAATEFVRHVGRRRLGRFFGTPFFIASGAPSIFQRLEDLGRPGKQQGE